MQSSQPTSDILRARIAAANGAGNGHDAMESVEGRSAEPAPEEDQISVIGAGILITGNIDAEIDLHIEGRVQGDVRCATLILGRQSTIVGSIYSQRVQVSGLVEGAIETVDLAIEGGARVNGDVSYSRLRIANGGIVAGQMTHVPLADAERGEQEAMVEDNQAAAPTKVHYIE